MQSARTAHFSTAAGGGGSDGEAPPRMDMGDYEMFEVRTMVVVGVPSY